MVNEDTIKLLKECNAGIKTAVLSIDEVLPDVKEESLREILTQSKAVHERYGDDTHVLLNRFHDTEKDPNPMAKAMSWMKINMKMMMNPEDKQVADLMFDGCNMGTKSLYRYLNQYANAEEEIKKLTRNIIEEEEGLRSKLANYL